jgi:ABC-type transport system involved in cytochrome c biogenesis permease subunit
MIRTPWFCKLSLALLLLAALSPLAHALDFSSIEETPIQEGGRKKPFLVFAQETLLSMSGKTALTIDGKKRDAVDIITSMWLVPAGWEKQPVILVNHKLLKKELGLDESKKLFSYQELVSNEKLRGLLSKAQTLRMTPGVQKITGLPKEAADVGMRLSQFETITKGTVFNFVANPNGAGAQWGAAPVEIVEPLRAAVVADDSAAFAKAAATFQSRLAEYSPQFQPPAWKIAVETTYQKLHPFRWAWICYAAAGIVLLLGRLGRVAYAAAWTLTLAGFLLQISGFAARISIAGRAPVTNMYESIIWVAFGTILFALIFEAIYRSRIFLLGAIPVAVASLVLADSQPVALNKAITPLVPVLRDNFWLSTHVLSITLSYAAFALALGIAHIVLGRVILGKKPEAPLYNYLYRTLQVGVLLLATGTILGGVWANYSWGRFWDWDPKETWALITLLGYLVVLHGRIAGVWGGFGLAIGSLLSFQCVLMAWYGVNFVLGVGLHSYGFGTGGFGWALLFVGVELAFGALAILRYRAQRGSRPVKAAKVSEQVA